MTLTDTPQLHALLAFDPNNRLAVRRLGSKCGLAFSGMSESMALERLSAAYPQHTAPKPLFAITAGGRHYQVAAGPVFGESLDAEVVPLAINELSSTPTGLAPSLSAIVDGLQPHLVKLPYLHLGENDFIYKFRPERNETPRFTRTTTSPAICISQNCARLSRRSPANMSEAQPPP